MTGAEAQAYLVIAELNASKGILKFTIGQQQTEFRDMDELLAWIKHLEGKIASAAGRSSGFSVLTPRSPSC